MKRRLMMFGLVLLAGVAGMHLYSSQLSAGNLPDGGAVTISRTGVFELDMKPERALPLFTGPGEELWAPGWNPTYLHGDGFEKGTVFITSHHGHTTYWLVTDYDTEAGHARYVRTTPGVDTGTVDVMVTSNNTGGSKVTVTYQVTGLSDRGNANVESFLDKGKYARMMKDWKRLVEDNRDKIDAHLSKH